MVHKATDRFESVLSGNHYGNNKTLIKLSKTVGCFIFHFCLKCCSLVYHCQMNWHKILTQDIFLLKLYILIIIRYAFFYFHLKKFWKRNKKYFLTIFLWFLYSIKLCNKFFSIIFVNYNSFTVTRTHRFLRTISWHIFGLALKQWKLGYSFKNKYASRFALQTLIYFECNAIPGVQCCQNAIRA